MEDVGARAFGRLLARLRAGDTGTLPGDELQPVRDVPALTDLPPAGADAEEALDRTVIIKVNGGLGTTMGLTGPKALVEVRPGRTFLDLIARQVLALRARHGARLPLVLLHSRATRDPSLAALHARHAELARQDVPLDLLQHTEPRLRARDLAPVGWCPPGHGDLYAALHATGTLAALRERGYRWAFASNADNLGAVLDPRILAWAAREGLPFLMEVVRGTAADRKGGHVARRGGRLVLRETAQVPDGDPSFGDHDRWRWYNANNLWLDLDALAGALDAADGVLDLPLIVNRKRVGGEDVLQLETAMGAALGVLDGARVLHVPRDRFVPVKGTDDLLVVRSDAYEVGDDGVLRPAGGREVPPFVALDPARLGRLADLDARIPDPPSLRRAGRLVVRGDVTFGRGVVVEGDVEVEGPRHVADGEVLRG